MSLPRPLLKPGALLYDNDAKTLPPHRRIFKLTALPTKKDELVMVHVASGSSRTVSMTAPGLELVPDKPDMAANLDCLVGSQLKLALASGTSLSGYCTGIVYHIIKVDGREERQVSAIELDHSGSTTFPWSDIIEIKKLK